MNSTTPVAEKSSWKYYVMALVFYVCALLSKTVTSSLPVVILLLLWWKRDKLSKADIILTIPFFVVGVGLGTLTIWMEKHNVGAAGAEWALTFIDRCLIAGRALCFYALKLFYPHKLIFIYSRWEINSGLWWQYLFPVAVIGVIIILWMLRKKIGKAPLVSVLFFAVTLFPALGFINVYPMRFSFVADHFQYLASIGLIVMSVGVVTDVLERFKLWHRYLKYVMSMTVLLVLGILTNQQTQVYKNAETLWRDTISKNPTAWIAHINLGVLLKDVKRFEEAEKEHREAIETDPNFADAHYNPGVLLYDLKRFEEAEKEYREAINVNPNYVDAYCNLGSLYYEQKQDNNALQEFEIALRLSPNDMNIKNKVEFLKQMVKNKK